MVQLQHNGLINSTEDFAAVNNDQTLQRYPEIVLTGIKQPFLNTPCIMNLPDPMIIYTEAKGRKATSLISRNCFHAF